MRAGALRGQRNGGAGVGGGPCGSSGTGGSGGLVERNGIAWGEELGEFWGVKWDSWREVGVPRELEFWGGACGGWEWVPKARSTSRGPARARQKGTAGEVLEVHRGPRQEDSGEGNSRRERTGEVRGCGGSEGDRREFLEVQRTWCSGRPDGEEGSWGGLGEVGG